MIDYRCVLTNIDNNARAPVGASNLKLIFDMAARNQTSREGLNTCLP